MTTLISYAQNFEDVMLWRALKHVENGFYIDLGAQDPIVDSVSLAFHERGWKGIHVEPTPHYAHLLRAQRPGDMVIEAAVGNEGDMLTFFEIPDSGISTADPQIAQQHRDRGFEIREITVPCIRLSSIFKTCGKHDIHWLKIDVEGFERSAITSWGKATARPWIVVVESTLPMTQTESYQSWEPLLLRRGYTPVYFDGLNRYYVSSEKAELKEAFNAPPNVFDGFSVSGTASSALHHYLVPRHAAELRAVSAQFQDAKSEAEALRQTLAASEACHGEQLRQSLAQIDTQRQEVLHTEQAHQSKISALQSKVMQTSALLIAEKDEFAGAIQGAQYEALRSAQALATREQGFSTRVAAREKAHRDDIAVLQLELTRTSGLIIAVKDENAGLLRATHQQMLSSAQALAAHEKETGARFLVQEQEFRKSLSAAQAEIVSFTNSLAAERDQNAILLLGLRRELINAEESLLGSEQRNQDEARRIAMRERQLGEKLVARADAFSALQSETKHEQAALRQEIETLRENAAQVMRSHQQREHDLLNEVNAGNAKLTLLEHAQARLMHDLQGQIAQSAGTNAQLHKMLFAARQEQEALQRTLSWRLTSPFRAISQRLKRNSGSDLASDVESGARSNLLFSGIPEGAPKTLPIVASPDQLQKALMSSVDTSRNSPTNTAGVQNLAELFSLEGEQFIAGAYVTLLKRSPDSSGSKFYLDRLLAGVAKIQILNEIGSSAEAQRSGLLNLAELLSLDCNQFVECAYYALLKRLPDSSGGKFYVGQLLKGVAKVQILDEIGASEEARCLGVMVPGLQVAIRQHRRARRPFRGLFVRLLSGVEGCSASEIRLRSIEQQFFLLNQHADARLDHLSQCMSELQRVIVQFGQQSMTAAQLAGARFDHLEQSMSDLQDVIVQQVQQSMATAQNTVNETPVALDVTTPPIMEPENFNELPARARDIYKKLRVAAARHVGRIS